MHPTALIPLLAAPLAAAMAAAIVARDPGQPLNRLAGVVLACSAYWSICDVASSLSHDPDTALRIIKLSSLGWIFLGPICLHILDLISGGRPGWLRRLVYTAYAMAGAAMLLHLATPWSLGPPIRTSWGWSLSFQPLFALAFAPTFVYVSLALLLLPRLFPARVSRGERRESRWLFIGIAVPLAVATTTDVALPLAGIHVPRLGSTSLLVFGAVVGRSLSRNGYYPLVPGAFARPILETIRDGVALLHPDGRIHDLNGGLARLHGSEPDALRDTPISEILTGCTADPEQEVLDRPAELLREDGGRVSVSISARILRDEGGSVIGRALAVRDLREVEALRSRLITAGRLAAVGELAAGIAHEINTPITYVHTNLGLLRRHWDALAGAVAKAKPEDPGLDGVMAEGEELLDESLQGVERVGAIVREVSAFSHAGLDEAERVDLNQLLENAVNVAALSYSVVVERTYADLPRVRCAPQQLRQVFLNLLLNALQAVGDYGHIRLSSEARGDTVTIRIEDDGCGIPNEQVERIFDPFFTTRPGEAVGLGLAHCYRIVRAHGGTFDVESEPRHGTRFEVILPVDGGEA